MILSYWNSRCFWFIWVLAHWSQAANFIKETPLLLHRDSTFAQSSYLIPTKEAHGKFSKCPKSQQLCEFFSCLSFSHPIPALRYMTSTAGEWSFRKISMRTTSTGMGKIGEVALLVLLRVEKQPGVSRWACVSSLHRNFAATHLKTSWQLQERTQTSSGQIFPLQHRSNKKEHFTELTSRETGMPVCKFKYPAWLLYLQQQKGRCFNAEADSSTAAVEEMRTAGTHERASSGKQVKDSFCL